MALYGAVSRHNVDQTVEGVKTFSGTLDVTGTLQKGGTTITASAAELNKMDGVTASTTELNYTDVTTISTSQASKSMVRSATNLMDGIPLNETQSVDPSQKVTLFDDFVTTTFDTNIWTDGEGSDDVALGPVIVANDLNGSFLAVSGDADNASGAVDTSGTTSSELNWQADSGGLVMEARVKINNIANSAIFVGFTDKTQADGGMEAPIEASGSGNVITAEAADAAGIIFDTNFATDPTFFHLGAVNNTSVLAIVVGTVVPVNATYITLRVTLTAAGIVEGFVNGTSIGTIASAITVADPVTPCVVVRGRTTAVRNLTVDYIWVQQNR